MVLTVLSLAANLGCHAVFVWGRYKVFRIDNRTPAGVRLIEASAAGSILVGLGLIVSRDGPRLALDACAIVLRLQTTTRQVFSPLGVPPGAAEYQASRCRRGYPLGAAYV
jgi:hypothetical protein